MWSPETTSRNGALPKSHKSRTVKIQITMATQFLRDRSGNMLGNIQEIGGKLYIFDYRGNRLGQYDPRINVTFDVSGNRIGTGNQLTRLL